MHANHQQMHVHFRRGILQLLLTQHAKTNLYVPQVTAKEANMQKPHKNMHCCGECKGAAEPTSSPSRKCYHKRSRNKLNCEFVNFYCVSVYDSFVFLCQVALVRTYCSDIMQLSLVNHHQPWFQQEGQTGKLLSTTGSLGITNTCTKPAPYITLHHHIILYKLPRF